MTKEQRVRQLLPESIKAKLLAANPSKAQLPVCKWFNAGGRGRWILFAAEDYPGEDTILWGVADLGYGVVEYGTASLNELTEYSGPAGLGIERDIHWQPDPKKNLDYYLGLDTLAKE
jgi:hypothetical protein